MSHFSKNVLQDYIRDGFIVEDQTGLCRRVFPRPVPRCRPGGIPILQNDKDESYFDSGSPEFEIDVRGFRKKQTICNQQIEEKDERADTELLEDAEAKFSLSQNQWNIDQNHAAKRSLMEE